MCLAPAGGHDHKLPFGSAALVEHLHSAPGRSPAGGNQALSHSDAGSGERTYQIGRLRGVARSRRSPAEPERSRFGPRHCTGLTAAPQRNCTTYRNAAGFQTPRSLGAASAARSRGANTFNATPPNMRAPPANTSPLTDSPKISPVLRMATTGISKANGVTVAAG